MITFSLECSGNNEKLNWSLLIHTWKWQKLHQKRPRNVSARTVKNKVKPDVSSKIQ